MQIYNVYQSGKRLYIDEKENPDNKIVVNKYDNMQQTLRLISDGTLPPRLYWALRNPKLSNKYFILKLVNNEDLIVGTDISAYAGLWDMLLIGTDEDYIIEGTDIDQSRLTYVSDHFGRLFVRDNFLEELDFEEQCSPTFRIFYDEIIFQLGNKADKKDIPDKLSDLENDTNFISGVALKDDGEGNVAIVGTTFSGGETEEGEIPSGGSIEVDDKLDEESTNPVQNQVVTKEIKTLKDKDESLDKEILTLREENEALEQKNAELESSIEKLQIKVTTEKASFHNIKDSANMKVLDFGMEGKTEQFTTSGKNLFDYKSDKWSTSIGDIQQTYASISLVDEGIQLINNVTGSNTWIVVYYEVDVEPNTVYQIKAKHNHNYPLSVYDSNGSLIGSDVTCDGKSIRSFTSPSDGKIYIKFSTTRGSAEPNDSTYTEIMLATDASVYEPYTGGQPSPNPDYPQEIINAGTYNEATGRYEIGCRVWNKNWFELKSDNVTLMTPKTPIENIENGIRLTYSNVNDSYIKLDFKLLPNTTYILSCNIKVESNNSNQFIAINITNKKWYSSDGCIAHANSTVNKPILKFTTPDTTEDIGIYLVGNALYSNITGVTEFTDFVISTDDSTYTPHASQHFTLTSPVPLTKWDYLTKRDGVWGWSIQDKGYNVSAEEAKISVNSCDEEKCRVYINNINAPNNTECLCNIFQTSIENNWTKTTAGFWWVNSFSVILFNEWLSPYGYVYDSSSTLNGANARDAFKAMLADKGNIRILVDMQEEQAFHPLPEEEQELLNNLETYYGVTNLYNDQGCPMWLTYIVDNQLYIDNKVQQINNALLSLGANV